MASDVSVTTKPKQVIRKCTLDENGCVSLLDILNSFNAPINEEHAWALCFQCAECFKSAVESDKNKCVLVDSVDQVFVSKEGTVHPKTLLATAENAGHRTRMTSEQKLVECLGILLFQALDFGSQEEEERRLSPDLERLIEHMTTDDAGERSQEADDEGIERDSCESENDEDALGVVIKMCMSHLGVSKSQDADNHYRAVCRALVLETLELSSFLEKVSKGTKGLRTTDNPSTELDQLKFTDWARLWGQVIRELRHGVQLKKVHYTRTPVEFELTPYEILMDDIRSRRYTLNKVSQADIPHTVKKDAHALILEFIRSRPPLKRASDRPRPKPRNEIKTPREQLLESILKGKKLRPSVCPLKKRVVPVDAPSSPGTPKSTTTSTRRLIKVDFSKLQIEDDDPEEDHDDEEEADAGADSAPRSNPWHRTAYDLATQCPSRRSMRRHTIMICEPVPGAPGVTPTVVKLPLEAETPLADACDLATTTNTLGLQLPELSWSRNSLQEDLFHSKQWQHECLSLTLEEIVHIRSVLTKAELESLPVEGRVKEDAERGKVCFLCMKTRFGFFGPRGQQCRLCNRVVCSKCHSKMRIPTEHFSHVPVVAISPSQLASPEDAPDPKSHDAATFSRTLMNRLLQTDSPRSLKHGLNSVGSAPSSPKLARADTCRDTAAAATTAPVTAGHSPATASQPNSGPGSAAESTAESMADSTEGPVSLPTLSPDSTTSDRRAKFNRSKTLGRPEKERLKGIQMIVCLDCKAMVLQIIKSSRTTRSNAIRNLTLNLSPVY